MATRYNGTKRWREIVATKGLSVKRGVFISMVISDFSDVIELAL
jgi:hypothetical protein